jgi:hypothetical protein
LFNENNSRNPEKSEKPKGQNITSRDNSFHLFFIAIWTLFISDIVIIAKTVPARTNPIESHCHPGNKKDVRENNLK